MGQKQEVEDFGISSRSPSSQVQRVPEPGTWGQATWPPPKWKPLLSRAQMQSCVPLDQYFTLELVFSPNKVNPP